jgi:hypothetical protein
MNQIATREMLLNVASQHGADAVINRNIDQVGGACPPQHSPQQNSVHLNSNWIIIAVNDRWNQPVAAYLLYFFTNNRARFGVNS